MRIPLWPGSGRDGAGARVQRVRGHALSLWNKVQMPWPVGVGIGVVRQADLYAAIDNAVTLPGFTRFDGAVFVALPRGARAQVDVENLLDRAYFPTAYNSNNISPGAPRTVRASLSTGW